ncbi:MAG: hypothetical protein Q4A30_01895 [Candidatus Saccharibacteria bacterium]|nr:hypothetical protein [Candidatus Saccharibacteria bacterium]
MKRLLVFVICFLFFAAISEPAQAKAYAFDSGSGPGVFNKTSTESKEVEMNPSEMKTAKIEVEVKEEPVIEFQDITPESEVYKSLVNLRKKGFILPWDGEEQLQPDKIVVEAEFAEVFYLNYESRVSTKSGEGHFTELVDVDNSTPYRDAIKWSLESGLLSSDYHSQSENIYFFMNKPVGYYFQPNSEKIKMGMFKTMFELSEKMNIKLPETHSSFISSDEGEQLYIEAKEYGYEGVLPLEKAGVITPVEDGSTGMTERLNRGDLIIYLDRYSNISGLGRNK